LELENTIIAGSGAGGNCSGAEVTPLVSLGGNVDTDGTCRLRDPSDLSGTLDIPLDPKLGPLQHNGRPTQPHALLPGSPAIDHGVAMFAPLETDQRGFPRIADGDLDGTAVIDAGAFELSLFGFGGLRGTARPFLGFSTIQTQDTSLPAGTQSLNLT